MPDCKASVTLAYSGVIGRAVAPVNTFSRLAMNGCSFLICASWNSAGRVGARPKFSAMRCWVSVDDSQVRSSIAASRCFELALTPSW